MSDRPLRILVVEDNVHDFAQIRRAYSKSAQPVDISHCIRAEEALELLTSGDKTFDVLISDFNLPGISGLDMCKRLLNQGVPFPLLMLTGTGNEIIAVEAMKAGISDYLIKDPAAGFLALLPDKVADVVSRFQEQQKMKRMEASIQQLSTAVEQSTCAVVNTDIEGRIEYANSKFSEVSGIPAADVIGKPLDVICSTPKDGGVFDGIRQTLAGGNGWRGEFEIKNKHNEHYWLHSSVSSIKDADGAVTNLLVILEDITDNRRLAQQLAKKVELERFQEIFNASPNALFMTNLEGMIILANEGARMMFGYSRERLLGFDINRLFPNSFEQQYSDLRRDYIDAKAVLKFDAALDTFGLRADDSNFPINVRLSSVNIGDDAMLLMTITDITARKQSQDKLHEEKERLRLTLESIGDAVITTDARGIVDYVNPIAERLTGFTLAEATGQALADVFPIFNEHDRKPCPNPVNRCLEKGKVVGLGNHTILINRDNEEYSIQDSAAPIWSTDGRILGVIMVFSDVTEQRRLNQQIAYQASHDALTELVNRREFDARLQRTLENAKEDGNVHALCYLDLDQFKVVNDTCGHVAGDELLRQVAIVLRQHIRTRDTLARLGGDEFGILMEHCGIDQANRIAESLRQSIGQYRFVWEDNIFNVGVSIGVVAISESDASAGDLLMKADTACYAAKRAGRNRIHVYQSDDVELSEHRGEMQWVSRIIRALEKDRFCLYYQPIRSLNGKNGLHYELLIRMKGKNDEIISPGAFMPAAERYALTTKIDCWVIQTAFRWLNAHPDHLSRLYQCAINLSGFSLGSREVLEEITTQLRENNIPAEKICFEITETAAILNLRYASKFIDQLRTCGCRFALDDFGSGLSSFAYLKNLAVDYLKIDGVFVKNIGKNPTDHAMVQSINEIGHVMGKETIAEFAEDNKILASLKAIGVDFAQGYGVGHPRPIEEVEYYRFAGENPGNG